MGRWWDILWMFIGIGVLILVSTSRGLEFRYGILGYIGAFACIGYGIKALIDSSREHGDLKRKIMQSPAVESFYENTKQAWTDGKLEPLGSIFAQEGRSLSLKDLKKNYPARPDSALEVFFSRYNPQPGEFLVSMSHGSDNTDNAWFVLTNKRLLQKNGETNDYHEFSLKDVEECVVDRSKMELCIKTRNGDPVILKQVARFPKKHDVDILASIL
jgi:hypothetical protein